MFTKIPIKQITTAIILTPRRKSSISATLGCAKGTKHSKSIFWLFVIDLAEDFKSVQQKLINNHCSEWVWTELIIDLIGNKQNSHFLIYGMDLTFLLTKRLDKMG